MAALLRRRQLRALATHLFLGVVALATGATIGWLVFIKEVTDDTDSPSQILYEVYLNGVRNDDGVIAHATSADLTTWELGPPLCAPGAGALRGEPALRVGADVGQGGDLDTAAGCADQPLLLVDAEEDRLPVLERDDRVGRGVAVLDRVEGAVVEDRAVLVDLHQRGAAVGTVEFQTSHLTALVTEHDQVLTENAHAQWEILQLFGERHWLPEAAQILPAGCVRTHVGKLLVLFGDVTMVIGSIWLAQKGCLRTRTGEPRPSASTRTS